MNRRDLLSTASAAGAGALVLTAGAQPASAGIPGLLSAGIVFKGCTGSAFNPHVGKSSDEKPYFQCDLVCEKDEKNFKCFEGKLLIFVIIKSCVVHYKEGKGRGKSEWKQVRCPDQKVWIPCDFDVVTKVLQIVKFGCRDEKGQNWSCYPKPVDCDNSSGNPGVLALIAQLVIIFTRLQKNKNDDCKDVIHQIFLVVVVVLIVIVCSPHVKET
jgi:hypothetical protein